MSVLTSSLRGQLERTVINARDAAEEAAKIALERLAVNLEQPFETLSPEERELRRRLRAKQRQLGSFARLVTECAYEYWHRMLFARFLAENHLLIHPEMGVPVTLEECAELAPEEGASNQWVLAERYAARMLPQIFRPDDPLLQMAFAPEHQQGLEGLLDGLPQPIFTADDSIGWVYQFWQTKRKDEINASGMKIGADEIGPVTQLFTEHYMVQFLLHNTLGAWWVSRHPEEAPPDALEYLRLLDNGSPAAGTFPGWPDTAKELRILDPCCGSGHFLVTALDLMVKFRVHEEGLSEADAANAVLRDNLFGLEIDQRCTQIAAFALAFAAWKRGGYRLLSEISVACSGIPVGAKRDEWLELAIGDQCLLAGMGQLYDIFKQAPELGSIIDPGTGSEISLFSAGFAELQPLLDVAMEKETVRKNDVLNVVGVTAQGVTKSAKLLSKQYNLIATNVPYLGRQKQNAVLRAYCESHYDLGKGDLASTFVARIQRFCSRGGTAALVTPQSWLFLGAYKKLRAHMLNTTTWNFLARLGPGAFETISGEVVNVMLLIFSAITPEDSFMINGLDASETRGSEAKQNALVADPILTVNQQSQLQNPDARVLLFDREEGKLLRDYADSRWGFRTGDFPRFGRFFWEIKNFGLTWVYQQSAPDTNVLYGGREYIIKYENGGGELGYYARIGIASPQGADAWGKKGIAVATMGNLCSTLYTGEIFNNNCSVVWAKDPKNLPAIWAYISSSEFVRQVRMIDQSICVVNQTLLKVPFDIERWQKKADEYGNLPEPYSYNPTQWLFKGKLTDSNEPLQIAVAQLLGYRWPEQDSDIGFGAFIEENDIICLPQVMGGQVASERLRSLLSVAYGEEWSPSIHEKLMDAVGYDGKTLNAWRRDGFFEQHCKLFHNRPFIWHIWDGQRDGFSALLNYHKLDARLLERLTYTYLGDWITRQQHDVKNNEGGSEARLLASRQLQEKLKLIIEGEAPYDIFVRWKPIEKQPIGWEPDLNDGVRLNIRPFITAGVLRWKPNIKWGIDRGKNPPGSPWGEERDNDRHLTLAEKRAARVACSSE